MVQNEGPSLMAYVITIDEKSLFSLSHAIKTPL